MTEAEIQGIIEGALKQVAPEIKFSAVNLKTPLRNQVDLDSYDFYNMLAQIEKATKVRVPETSLREMTDLSSLIRYLVEHTKP
ncbi:MAG: acyl carrier protein [Pseudobdellovibrionaceae bacterium]